MIYDELSDERKAVVDASIAEAERLLLVRAASLVEVEEQRVETWQYLIDTGRAWELPGWVGRVANNMIEAGVCHSPVERT